MMKIVKLKLKYGKDVQDVELDMGKDVKTFKEKLESLTGVPAERQTLISKGAWIGTLKDGMDLSTLKPIPQGHTVTLIGSAAKVQDTVEH